MLTTPNAVYFALLVTLKQNKRNKRNFSYKLDRLPQEKVDAWGLWDLMYQLSQKVEPPTEWK